MATITELAAAQITLLQRTVPKTWRTITDTLIDVDPSEFAALRALPHSSVLFDGDRVRVAGLANIVVNVCAAEAEAAMLAEIATLNERITSLRAQLDAVAVVA